MGGIITINAGTLPGFYAPVYVGLGISAGVGAYPVYTKSSHFLLNVSMKTHPFPSQYLFAPFPSQYLFANEYRDDPDDAAVNRWVMVQVGLRESRLHFADTIPYDAIRRMSIYYGRASANS